MIGFCESLAIDGPVEIVNERELTEVEALGVQLFAINVSVGLALNIPGIRQSVASFSHCTSSKPGMSHCTRGTAERTCMSACTPPTRCGVISTHPISQCKPNRRASLLKVPDITYLALRRLVAMGVLEELVAAASLGLENPSQRKLAREIEREHAQLAACQRGHRLDESATAAIYATTCHIPGGRKTLRCLLTGTPVVPLDCLRSTTAPRVCRLSSSRTTSHLTTATLLSAHCFDRL
jgi:hypothetical protein